MEQSKIQGDNQQENLLWWLGGIIDGEGCITINHHRLHLHTSKETLLFSPTIIIVNTNKVLIDKCQEILQTINIPFYVSFRPSSNPNHKEKWAIVITGIKRCVRALNILSQYLIAKKEEADLVKKFCESRLAQNGIQNKQNGRNCTYSEKDFEIILRVAQIHNRNPQRLYAEIRQYQAKQDKVRTSKET